ncbi:TetR/AcrR family transcriptional regulator C-terminal domain-containing protein [Streptomyces sp. TP-A0356]|uniref:TetR/AcrR family transcriptional regulator C-terminal domain-containing protein n=1 Tax=Streptomyces sp. TP-A0356 TaxID=1359208 RepID=UPI0006E3D2B9|nr:TetR/AcrR family transcriptional regulator C-terminal domain-containing protein [Streptomyces sp. TP-A0356]
MADERSASVRIAGEIAERIRAGELRPGERVPSTRQIMGRWGVAMATASKALAMLRQEGLVRAVPGVGTVVAESVPGRPRSSGASPRASLDRAHVVRTAVAIADAEGLTAVSMRRVAAALGVTTMALYRHVPGRDELTRLMADAVFGSARLPELPAAGWRRRLEAAARLQWRLYRRHPWLAQAISFTRPQATPHAMALGEWVMRALDGLGLDPVTMIHIHVTLAAHVRGIAVNLEAEAEALQQSGVDDEEWMAAHMAAKLATPQGAERFPLLAAVPERSLDLDSLFEFGLQRLLDGIDVQVAEARP